MGLDKSVQYGIGLMVLFVIVSTVMLPQFEPAWKYCQAREWNPDNTGAVGGNCTNVYTNTNSSPVTASPHTESGLTDPVDSDSLPIASISNYCLNCDTEGGYRDSISGMILLVLVLGVIAMGLYFFSGKLGSI